MAFREAYHFQESGLPPHNIMLLHMQPHVGVGYAMVALVRHALEGKVRAA